MSDSTRSSMRIAQRSSMRSVMRPEQEVTLLELVDRVLDKGVVLWGEVVLSVADIDLVYLGLKLLLTSVENTQRLRTRTLYAHSSGPIPSPEKEECA